MCTVSWVEDPEGLHVFCNRDEMRNREDAAPPTVAERDGVHYLAPQDGRAGGSWIAANQHGMAICLLNHYNPEAVGPGPFPSRGELVLSLMRCTGVDEVRAMVTEKLVAEYRPCILLAFQRGAPVERFTWNRETLTHDVIDRMEPHTSSSFLTQAVIDSRISFWRNLVKQNHGVVDLELLDTFHASHHPSKGAYSVCMHRPDAHTVSYTRLLIGGESVAMNYQVKAPCKAAPAEQSVLPLAACTGA